jgi:DNA polymerase-4
MSEPLRKIIHIDMDCFYAAVEMRDNPKLRGKPIAVGGRERQRGVVATCNYEARAFGVHSAMATAQAVKLCPQLIVVPGRMEVYKSVSKQIRAIFEQYTSIIEPLSLDEAFLDVSDSPHCRGSATLMAAAIRQQIFEDTGLTASAGIAPLKFLAKIASDENKPNGQCVIEPAKAQAFIDDLDLKKIPGVGKVGLSKLNAAGLYTCLDVRQSDFRQLLTRFGRLGASLWRKSHGIDSRAVVTERERKSVGVERTLSNNVKTYDECWALIEEKLFPELQTRLEKTQRDIIKQGVKLKFDDFQLTTIEHGHQRLELNDYKQLLREVLERQKGREIRLIGLHVTLKPLAQSQQLSLL